LREIADVWARTYGLDARAAAKFDPLRALEDAFVVGFFAGEVTTSRQLRERIALLEQQLKCGGHWGHKARTKASDPFVCSGCGYDYTAEVVEARARKKAKGNTADE
jgi:hypothetical protein